MEIETLGDAYTHSVKVKMWCAEGPQNQGMKRGRECQFSCELDTMTLVATRGRKFPIAWLGTRLRCPRCHSVNIRVRLIFPSEPKPNAGLGVADDVARAEAVQRRVLGK
ncbi:hypothetical protein MAUB1S_09736 [Mycolicibacterium aubagnense]